MDWKAALSLETAHPTLPPVCRTQERRLRKGGTVRGAMVTMPLLAPEGVHSHWKPKGAGPELYREIALMPRVMRTA